MKQKKSNIRSNDFQWFLNWGAWNNIAQAVLLFMLLKILLPETLCWMPISVNINWSIQFFINESSVLISWCKQALIKYSRQN